MSLCRLLFLLCFPLLSACTGQRSQPPPAGGAPYTFRDPSPDGTGKVYLGREISYVMGHRAADWLERPEREAEENVSQAIENMGIRPDERIADIGAGSGYYTFRLAELVPRGRVYAVDLQPEMLALMEQKIARENIDNVTLVRGTETDHGACLIATRDVAELMTAGAVYPDGDNRIFEAGGPEWLTWRNIGQRIAAVEGRERLRLIPLPAWFARFGQLVMRPFAPAAANVLGLTRFVAAYQPRWEDAAVVRELDLPRQQTVEAYLAETETSL